MTSQRIASLAAKMMDDPNVSEEYKEVAASALSDARSKIAAADRFFGKGPGPIPGLGKPTAAKPLGYTPPSMQQMRQTAVAQVAARNA